MLGCDEREIWRNTPRISTEVAKQDAASDFGQYRVVKDRLFLNVRRRAILVLGRDYLADQVIVGLRQDGHRARRLDRLDPMAPDLNRTAFPLEPAVLDPARTPILILADPPDAPDLVATLVARAREAARQRRAGRPP
ncbi:MAG: hypothetical protein WAT23_14300, partial [Chromatiaceae bacterium]